MHLLDVVSRYVVWAWVELNYRPHAYPALMDVNRSAPDWRTGAITTGRSLISDDARYAAPAPPMSPGTRVALASGVNAVSVSRRWAVVLSKGNETSPDWATRTWRQGKALRLSSVRSEAPASVRPLGQLTPGEFVTQRQ